ncbi:MAG: hypothetical protein JNK04_25470 [Myxococcales bacterium]|nr:hypothetical protein [Myxococcales bacterium]
MPEEPDPIPDPCDETLKAQLQCVEDCEYDVSCDALKGYDLNAWAAWESCHQSCQ